MKKLLTVCLALAFIFSFSFAAENGENVFLKVWDSTEDEPGDDLWDVR